MCTDRYSTRYYLFGLCNPALGGVYLIESKSYTLGMMGRIDLRSRLVCARLQLVRRFFGFLQYGTSARLVAPPEMHARARACPSPRFAAQDKRDTPKPGGKQSSPRPLARLGGDSGRDGAETLRVPATAGVGSTSSPAYADRRGPQGKAAVDSIVAGTMFTRGV